MTTASLKQCMRVVAGNAYRFVLMLAYCFVAVPMHADEHYPPFSWDRVPVYAHVGKASDDFTDKELDFLAKHFDFITIEKGQAVRKHGNTEDGFIAAARGIKQRNPDAKVIFYWNGFLDITRYKAQKDFPKDGHLIDRNGKPVLVRERVRTYDLRREDVRTWWTDVATQAVHNGLADGIFIDALPKVAARIRRRELGRPGHEALQDGLAAMLRETRRKLGPNKLMIYNGMRGGEGTEHLPTTDGAMIEHFDSFTSATKEKIVKDLDAMREAARDGKIVILKAWPGFSWLDGDTMKLPREKRVELAQKNITFPLACFLVAAEQNCYFCYTWGYQEQHGTLEWYPEFDKPLGPPQGDAVKDGWTYTRAFEHANVFVDLQRRTARIDWNN
ncbi:MAG: putative glycoside hydrolase family 15 protein [Phycisphaeraceae bacterium]|nr:putative glycoside hydrolase family 15 protein [Phycisphaeraceae bacterium]